METLFNSPDKFKSRFAEVDGYKTHFIEAGSEEADRLILVHGGACEIGMGNYRWYPNIIPLSRHFHVYAIDELGHGQTDPPRDPEKDLGDVRSRAEHVINFIDTLKLAPINLVGQSQGGWIVTYITIKRPDLVKRLVLIDSASTAGSNVKSEGEPDKTMEVDGVEVKVDGSWELPYFKEIFEPGTMCPKEGLTTTREGIRKYVGTFFYDKSMLTEEFLDHLEGLSRRWSDLYDRYRGKEYWKRGIAKNDEMYFFDGAHIRDHVKKIKTPTLVLWGRNSNKGIDAGVALYKRISGAQMHVFDKANHFLWLDQWQDFNSLVTWFLSKPEENL